MSQQDSSQPYKHQARKRFGQNFLVDQQIIEKIIRAISPKENDNLVEIGPGQGAITEPLLSQVKRLNAVEVDRDLAQLLQQKFSDHGGFVLHQGDALKFDFGSLATNAPLRVIGNLPYNISTPLIFHLLNFAQNITDMHFMLQKEVVERMAALPGNKTYGRLSVIVQYHCQVSYVFTVPPHAFQPAPKVESAIVRIVPRPTAQMLAKNTDFFYKIVKTTFQQRRKTLRNTLKNMDVSGETSIDLTRRPETLSVAEFVQLSNELEPSHA